MMGADPEHHIIALVHHNLFNFSRAVSGKTESGKQKKNDKSRKPHNLLPGKMPLPGNPGFTIGVCSRTELQPVRPAESTVRACKYQASCRFRLNWTESLFPRSTQA
ncbi:hypothetical protein HNQ53_002228 [Microbulbifer hydrolyticus]|uniref:Uncharacterized protein n=1 Tax=Microbulbifer hydrolyticus TaxID=48074 RepID=A0AA89THC8_9GAMM|nr:hypothetical protein [Microbulbifer hydrolyticus]